MIEKPGILSQKFEILAFSHIGFEALGILSNEIPSISKTRSFDSKAGTKKIIMSCGSFCFFQMFRIVTKRRNAGSAAIIRILLIGMDV